MLGQDMTMSKFGPRLRSRREAKGISGNRLSQLTGIDQSTLSKIERGIRLPSRGEIVKIAAVSGLGLSVDEMQAWADADRLGEEGLEGLKKYVLEFPRDDARVQSSDEGLVAKMAELLGELSPRDRDALLNKAADLFKRKTTEGGGT